MKRNLTYIAAALLLTACGGHSPSSNTLPGSAGAGDSGNTASPPSPRQTDQVIIAHRGASGHAPEHTLIAYDLALDMGTEYIEQDVLPTADGQLIVIHDDSLDRTARGDPANCSGMVSSKTVAQIKTCDFGSWFNETFPDRAKPEYVGLTAPTLEEVFQRYGTAVNYYIEIKPNTATTDSVETELLRLINLYGLREGAVQRRQVIVQSFIPASLRSMNTLDPGIPLVQLYPQGTATAGLADAATYAFGVGPHMTEVQLNTGYVQQAQALGLAVHPYTVNSEADLETFAALCVDGAFTNFPDRYDAVLQATDYNCQAPIR